MNCTSKLKPFALHRPHGECRSIRAVLTEESLRSHHEERNMQSQRLGSCFIEVNMQMQMQNLQQERCSPPASGEAEDHIDSHHKPVRTAQRLHYHHQVLV